MKIQRILLVIIIFTLFVLTAEADYTIGPDLGGSVWSGNSTGDNTTENLGSSVISVGSWADNFDDGDEDWTLVEGNPMVVTYEHSYSSPYSIRNNATAGAKSAEQKTFSNTNANVSIMFYDNISMSDEALANVYDGVTNCMILYNGGVNNSYYIYRIGGDYYNTPIARSTGWHEFIFDYNSGTNVKGYIDDVHIFTNASISHFDRILIGNIWDIGTGDLFYYDDVRIYNTTSGNQTIWHDALSGNWTNNMVINATGNWSGYYRQNATGNFVSHVSNQLGNQSVAISGSKYQNTDYRVEVLDGDLIGITFNTQASSAAPSITSYAPSTPNSSWANVDKTFNFTSDQTGNHTYWMNDNLVQTNTSVTTSTYTNLSVNNKGLSGLQNLTMKVENTNGTDTQKIDWTIDVNYVTTNVTYDDRTNLSYNRIFDIITITPGVENVSIGYGNTDSGNSYGLYFSNGTQIASSQTASSDNETVWFNETVAIYVVANDYFINETLSLPGITNVTNGSISSTSQYIDWDVNLTANNQVIYDTGAQGADSTDWSATWTADHGAANASDSNWSSYAESAGAGTEYLYFNYTIPSGANRSHSVLHIKDGDAEANLTIPSTCWNVTEGTIYVRASVSDIANSVTWSAYTGSVWTTIRGPNAPNTVYEQEMTFKYTSSWDNSTNSPNITLSGLTASTGYNFVVWSYNMGDITRNSSSNTYSFTTSAAANASTIIIPANAYGMFNNWTVATNFSNIAANESNDVCYTYYNVTTGEWDSHYPPYSWNSDYVIPIEASIFMFVDAETTVTATIVTPSSTELYVGWNMLFIEGTDNESVSTIIADIGANCTDVWGYNSTAGAYTNASAYSIQPNQGILTYINTPFTWTRSDL